MLWQVAYAEWVFPQVLWPDFRAGHFLDCLHAYQRRERRFGGVLPAQGPGEGSRRDRGQGPGRGQPPGPAPDQPPYQHQNGADRT
jgi:undecaprenyl diphosphate synthase